MALDARRVSILEDKHSPSARVQLNELPLKHRFFVFESGSLQEALNAYSSSGEILIISGVIVVFREQTSVDSRHEVIEWGREQASLPGRLTFNA